MNVYISLLRGINVGGSKILSMDTVCDIYAGIGFTHIHTYLQSGNVIFVSPQDDRSQLAGQIESRIKQICGFHVDVFIRQAHDFQSIITHNPFLDQLNADPSKLHVSFLYQALDEASWSKLVVPADIPDKLARGDLAIYLYYPNGVAKAKISTSYLEKVLGVSMTNRNWNTVNALFQMALESQSPGG